MTYLVINTIVKQGDPELSAAQAHGAATGILCVNEWAQSDDWLHELFRDGENLNDHDKDMLARLFEQTRTLLTSDEFEFDLLLPGDDETPLSDRVEALTQWCQGFLLGLGVTHAKSEWSRDASGILKDMVEFTKLDTDAAGEDDENDFMEITEYLRSAVLLLRSEQIGDSNRHEAGDTLH